MKNKIGSILYAIGILFISIGFIATLILFWYAIVDDTSGFFGVYALIVLVSSFVTGIVFLGFTQVLKLLEDNLNINEKILETNNTISKELAIIMSKENDEAPIEFNSFDDLPEI